MSKKYLVVAAAAFAITPVLTLMLGAMIPDDRLASNVYIERSTPPS